MHFRCPSPRFGLAAILHPWFNSMVQLPTVQKAVAALVSSQPLVAVFVGGTSGIGQNTVRELARTHGTEGPGLRIYLVGRNRKTAEDTIAICRQHCPQGNFIFVQSKDLALLKDVDDMCSEITRLETETARREKSAKAHVDMLYISTMQVRSGREGQNNLCSFLMIYC